MKRLDAYARITCKDASALATAAITGIGMRRRARAADEADRFMRHMTRPRGLRRRPKHTGAEARQELESWYRKFRAGDAFCWDEPGYDYWWSLHCLHSDELRAAKALLKSAAPSNGKGRYILINPEDMADLRRMGVPGASD